jgi:CRP/FNR family cyclic AMP-dependent transcriptional regulator
MPEDFLGLFRNETDIVTLQPGQVLFEKGRRWTSHVCRKIWGGAGRRWQSLFRKRAGGRNRGRNPRSATVRALRESVVIPVDETRFSFLVQQAPFFAIRVMRVMSARLEAMNERITSVPGN